MGDEITASEVLRHNHPQDVWIVVEGKVYDMTEFAKEHPGGPEIIYRYAGKDATKAYNEVHSPSLIKRTLKPKKQVGALSISSITEEWRKANLPRGVAETASTVAPSDKPGLDTIINLDDFEKVAQKFWAPKPWAFINGGTNDNITRDANNAMLRRIILRPKVMRNVGEVNTKTNLFGCKLSLPIFISPTGGARMAGSEGELALARGATAGGIIHCFATPSSYPHSEILDATEKHAFFQLYVNRDRAKSEIAIRDADSTGKIRAIIVTVDVPVIPKRDDDERVASGTQALAMPGSKDALGSTKDKRGAGFARRASSFIDSTFNWDDLKWIRKVTDKPIVVKGIQRASDAEKACKLGCEGIVLSNHGGRAADTAPPAILTLLELQKHCPHVFKHMTVLVDGGFRRGVDVVKAICLGASAVGLGRPFLYSLHYGQQGVEHAIDIIRDEIETATRLCGMTDLMRDAHPDFVNSNDLDHLVPGPRHPYAKRIARSQSPFARLLPKL